MPGATSRYGLPYQSAGDAPDGPSLGKNLAEATEALVGPVDDRVLSTEGKVSTLEALVESKSIALNAFTNPLVSAANTDTLVTALTFQFRQGYAYEVRYSLRFQVNGGSSPYSVYARIKRVNAGGTLAHDSGGTAAVGGNFMAMVGRATFRRTGATTTQTLALTLGFSSTGTPTALDVEAAPGAPATLTIACVGLADNFPGATEIPTA